MRFADEQHNLKQCISYKLDDTFALSVAQIYMVVA